MLILALKWYGADADVTPGFDGPASQMYNRLSRASGYAYPLSATEAKDQFHPVRIWLLQRAGSGHHEGAGLMWKMRGGWWTTARDGLRRRSQSPKSAESTMKQQRPFVVEIKQKRGLVKRPESIWAGIDLAAIANGVAKANTKGAVAEATRQPIGPGGNLSQPVFTTSEEVSQAKEMTVPDASRPEPPTIEKAPVPDASHAPTGDRRTRRKKRWQKDVPLPRGERWKRRLPWALRQSRAER